MWISAEFSYLEFIDFLGCLMLFLKLGSLGHYFFRYSFCFFSPLLRLPIWIFGMLDSAPQVSESLLIFLHSFFCFSDWIILIIIIIGTSLVTQWLRIRLPMKGTRVQALVREDPTCCRATKSVCHSYWACALEPMSHNYWAHVPQLLKPMHLKLVLRNKRSHHNEKPIHHNKE